MLARHLVLIMGSTPLGIGTTFGDIRKLIRECADDDVDQMKVWRVYDVSTMEPSSDATVEFASDWAERLTRSEAMPAFIRHHHPELRREYAA